MKTATTEWVEKAEGDYRTAQREEVAQPPNYDATAFHAQQCVEKCLKARLIEAGVSFPKTHDLAALLVLALPLEATWQHLLLDLDGLSSLGIEVRYPGVKADAKDAAEALRIAGAVRSLVRPALGLPSAEETPQAPSAPSPGSGDGGPELQ
ncbi:MAG: HEPN domain-containing protein [Planctomycetes bacterium]|nr:HEPN domain-containing protein [Planctomycetota bacterium]